MNTNLSKQNKNLQVVHRIVHSTFTSLQVVYKVLMSMLQENSNLQLFLYLQNGYWLLACFSAVL